MIDNPQLDLFAPRAEPDPAGSWLEKFLRESRCWMTVADIIQTTKGRALDRDIREIASQPPYHIITGQKGLRHMIHSTMDEINHCANGLESRAKKIGDRAGGIRREAHKIFG